MEKIRFGIVGIGMMGRMHATSLQRNPHAEVVAVCALTLLSVRAQTAVLGDAVADIDVRDQVLYIL